MCGRFYLDRPGSLAATFGVTRDTVIFDALAPRYNIAPSQQIASIRQEDGERAACLLRWGLIPAWSREPATKYSTINARAETVAEKPAYRSAFRSRRCLIPATGFYEWRQTNGKQPYRIGLPHGEPFAFAGLWERWTGDEVIESCTIIVTAANDAMRAIHDRMPAILDAADYDLWLDPVIRDRDCLLPLLAPWRGEIDIRAVSKRVNNPRNDDPGCLAAVGE